MVARNASGVVLSIFLGTVTQALTIFYALLGVTLFVPILGGLYSRRATAAALAAIVDRCWPRFSPWRFVLTARVRAGSIPTLTGMIAAAIAYGLVMLVRSSAQRAASTNG